LPSRQLRLPRGSARGMLRIDPEPFESPFDRLTVLSKVEGLTAPREVEGRLFLPRSSSGAWEPSNGSSVKSYPFSFSVYESQKQKRSRETLQDIRNLFFRPIVPFDDQGPRQLSFLVPVFLTSFFTPRINSNIIGNNHLL